MLDFSNMLFHDTLIYLFLPFWKLKTKPNALGYSPQLK